MGLNFRPHHFLCALCFQGKGYSPAFISNFTAIMETLNQPGGEDTPITVTLHTDSICSPCPHRQDTLCASQESIEPLDRAHATALHLTPSAMLTWAEAKNRIRDTISLDVFDRICRTCSWKELGICEQALATFLD